MDLDTLLAESAPARHVRLDSPDSPAAVRLYRQLTGQLPTAGTRPRRRPVALAVTATAVTATAAASVIAVLATGPGSPAQAPGAGPHPQAAAAVLARVALTAARQPASAVPGPGHYFYVETIEGQRDSGGPSHPNASGICVQTVRVWAARDGVGLEVSSAPSGVCDGYIPSQRFRKGQQIDFNVYPRAAELPRNPSALERFIARHFEGGPADAAATFQFAGTFLQSDARRGSGPRSTV